NRLSIAFVVGDSFKRLATESAREYRTHFGGAEVVFHVELDCMNLIEEAFLETCVFEHLAVDCSLFFIDDSLDRGIAGDERCIRNFETRSLRRSRWGDVVALLPTFSTSSATTTTATVFVFVLRFGNFFGGGGCGFLY